ncbi:MAG: serine--tRNA ligase, partial [Nocardiopsaceae bacterium]|nr:serine--tRNA ligase [Nocardiopsaceae bacterium]
MIDLKAARQNPEAFRAALARRDAAQDFDELLAADASWRKFTESAESLRAQQKRSSRGKPSPDELDALKELSAKIDTALQQQAVAAHHRDEILARIPNLPDPTAADGMDEEDSQVLRTVGDRPTFDFEPKDHLELGSERGWIDMVRGARLSGSRFAYRV